MEILDQMHWSPGKKWTSIGTSWQRRGFIVERGWRKVRMEVINNLDQESREKLKQEFQVYTRQKRMNQPLSIGPII
jgi:hypothetical protein